MTNSYPRSMVKVLDDLLTGENLPQLMTIEKRVEQEHRLDDVYLSQLAGRIEERASQNQAVTMACEKSSGLWATEMAPGCGKSVVAARIALQFASRGRVIYICPSRIALGDYRTRIINKFHRVWRQYTGDSSAIGFTDEPEKRHAVLFFTPWYLVDWLQEPLIQQILDSASILITDEAHHFPSNAGDTYQIYGKIDEIANRYFLARNKKVVALTGTYGRTDGRLIFAKASPDYTFTVQQAVNERSNCELHGAEIYLDVNDDDDIKLEGDEFSSPAIERNPDYWRRVAGCMATVWRALPYPTCAFVRLRKEAEYLVRLFNHETGLGDERGLAVYLGDTPNGERNRILEDIQDGKRLGYVTASAGEESLDLPQLQIAHLIRRTCSPIKTAQAIGRIMRPWPGKRCAYVYDYQLKKEEILKQCQGLLEYVQLARIEAGRKIVNGGPLVRIEGPERAIYEGMTIEDSRAWVLNELRASAGTLEPVEAEPARPLSRHEEWHAEETWARVGDRTKMREFYQLLRTMSQQHVPIYWERIQDHAVHDWKLAILAFARQGRAFPPEREMNQHHPGIHGADARFVFTIERDGQWIWYQVKHLFHQCARLSDAAKSEYDPEFAQEVLRLLPAMANENQ